MACLTWLDLHAFYDLNDSMTYVLAILFLNHLYMSEIFHQICIMWWFLIFEYLYNLNMWIPWIILVPKFLHAILFFLLIFLLEYCYSLCIIIPRLSPFTEYVYFVIHKYYNLYYLYNNTLIFVFLDKKCLLF